MREILHLGLNGLGSGRRTLIFIYNFGWEKKKKEERN
jgi:hypothetical protein